LLYSEYSEIDKKKLETNNEDDYWDSEEDYDHDYLSEENDHVGRLNEYQNEKKLNNDLTTNIQKNNRLKSGLSSYSNQSDKSKSRFK